jgi:endoglucanase
MCSGCIARWKFPCAHISDGIIHTDACDDLAAVAAALCAFGELLHTDGCGHVGLLFTVAEEVGFIGTIHAARNEWIPKSARLLCLENSRSFPHDSPIGAGAILRVGDRISVFTPSLTNHLAHLFSAESKRNPAFKWQRKLMPGGGCEASAFACYGYQSTCICLPLGSYHNMQDIDGVAAGTHPARVGQEFVSVDDFHSMITMLHLSACGIDVPLPETTEQLMERLYAERSFVLNQSRRDP